ncbi:PREDICTED: snRNA-activating protein complex subunit 5-like [Polistes canadensis]|uniref:snRNA-activating protein complex subunit 5-like n=1 Tax=Polistes canadensis TaxID=91411 RepID=UPI000718C1A7|nr:PREDICTED: snRNA-activating protein complex subunit 5-like [Polistes canadensis]
MSKTYNRLKELRKFRTQVDKERSVLKNVLSKLDQQIDALQVEQLNLISLINAKNNTKEVRKDTNEESSLQTNNQVTNQKLLDLSVPLLMDVNEEESEDDNNSNAFYELADILENEINN